MKNTIQMTHFSDLVCKTITALAGSTSLGDSLGARIPWSGESVAVREGWGSGFGIRGSGFGGLGIRDLGFVVVE